MGRFFRLFSGMEDWKGGTKLETFHVPFKTLKVSLGLEGVRSLGAVLDDGRFCSGRIGRFVGLYRFNGCEGSHLQSRFKKAGFPKGFCCLTNLVKGNTRPLSNG